MVKIIQKDTYNQRIWSNYGNSIEIKMSSVFVDNILYVFICLVSRINKTMFLYIVHFFLALLLFANFCFFEGGKSSASSS